MLIQHITTNHKQQIKMNVGTAIKQLRKEAKLTQGKFAELTGINQGYISLIENGQKQAHTGTLLTMAEQLNVPLAVIYIMAIGQDDIWNNDPTDANVLAMLETGKSLILQAL